MELVGLALGAAGIVGASGFTAGFRYSQSWRRQRRFLRLRRTETLEMVLPTSERTNGGVGFRYMRSVTAVGNLRGATTMAQAVGRISRAREVSVAVSEELETSLSNDLAILGLPAKNRASSLAIAELQRCHPSIGLLISELEQDCRICLGDITSGFVFSPQACPGELPSRDIALVVLWVNPFSLKKRRLLLCAGYTAYGTAAAASYLVNDVLQYRYRKLRKESRRKLPSLLMSRAWPCFALVLEFTLVNDQIVNTKELSFVPLEDPGCPPF